MSLDELRTSWEKSNILPEEMKQKHISNLEKAEKSGIKVIKERVHVDVMNTLIQKIKGSEEYEFIEPVHDIVLQLLDAKKDVRLVSSLPADIVKDILKKIAPETPISELQVIDRPALFEETSFGSNGHYELLIDDSEEKLVSVHATHLYPRDIVELANNRPS